MKKINNLLVLIFLLFISCTSPNNKKRNANSIAQNGELLVSVFKKDFKNNRGSYHVWTKDAKKNKEQVDSIREELGLLSDYTIYLYSDSTLDEGHYYAYCLDYFKTNPIQKYDTQKQIDLINLEKQKKDYMTDEEAIQARKEYERKKQEEYNSIYERIISYSDLHFVKSFSDIKQFLVIIKDTENAILMGGDSDIKEKTKKSLSSFQKINFPLARKMYYNNAKEKLWEKNIEVKLSGRNITFEGYMFADNGTIKATYEEIRKELEDLRFKTVGFRWYEGGDRTYWKLNVKNDGDI
jgi:hypothetical protein